MTFNVHKIVHIKLVVVNSVMHIIYDIKELPTSEVHYSATVLLQRPVIVAHFVFVYSTGMCALRIVLGKG